jgi:hypothetical protein
MQNNTSKLNTFLLVLVFGLLIAVLFWQRNLQQQVDLNENRLDKLSLEIIPYPENTITDTGNNYEESENTVSGVTLQPSSLVNDPYKYYVADGGFYVNNKFQFKMQLSKGVRLSSISKQNSLSILIHTNPSTPHLRYFGVNSQDECEDGQKISVNNIEFTRTIGHGNYGGMETGSFDAGYCTLHNGMTYRIGFTHIYSRVGPTAITPDEAADLITFEKELKLLDFTFTN